MMLLGSERISWVDPSRYHITLRFIGKTRIGSIDQIGQALGERIVLPHKTEISINQLGSFGPRDRPRVIWIGFRRNGFFQELREGVDQALEENGIRLEETPFRAHLTLGRIRSLKDRERFHSIIDSMKAEFCGSVLFEKLVFYRSELREEGPRYTPLFQWEFRD